MKEGLRTLVLLVAVAVVLAILAPGVILGFRLADTWSRSETQSLLGGGLAICGGGATILAVMAGAGAFARLAGWRPPRREDDRPRVIDVTPAAPQLPAPSSVPPWGMTGGGQYELLPPADQDRRYTWTAPETEVKSDKKR